MTAHPSTPSKRIKDMRPGELFRAFNRVCTLQWWSQVRGLPELPKGTSDELLVTSIVDGWQGRLEQFGEQECESIAMPQTPLELVWFIREYQTKYLPELEV